MMRNTTENETARESYGAVLGLFKVCLDEPQAARGLVALALRLGEFCACGAKRILGRGKLFGRGLGAAVRAARRARGLLVRLFRRGELLRQHSRAVWRSNCLLEVVVVCLGWFLFGTTKKGGGAAHLRHVRDLSR